MSAAGDAERAVRRARRARGERAGRLLGLGGYAFAGKDAAADVLEANGWYRTYMSKSLHEAMLVINPIVRAGTYGDEDVRYAEMVTRVGYSEAKKKPEVRRLLQVFATEFGRNMVDQDIWLNMMMKEVQPQISVGRDVVVTGVRFLNEVHFFEFFGGKTVWVSRPGIERVNQHCSEDLVPAQFDYCLNNDGTLADLPDKLRELGLIP